ncbi:TPA: hypothetical protein PDF33_002208 [Staphylococcus aureus]|nr:hypothetical protein [Staphylococcus aureus]
MFKILNDIKTSLKKPSLGLERALTLFTDVNSVTCGSDFRCSVRDSMITGFI